MRGTCEAPLGIARDGLFRRTAERLRCKAWDRYALLLFPFRPMLERAGDAGGDCPRRAIPFWGWLRRKAEDRYALRAFSFPAYARARGGRGGLPETGYPFGGRLRLKAWDRYALLLFHFLRMLERARHTEEMKKPTTFRRSAFHRRRGGDSNPRYRLTQYGSLANCWFQPLTHLSVGFKEHSRSNRAANIDVRSLRSNSAHELPRYTHSPRHPPRVTFAARYNGPGRIGPADL